MQKEKRVCIISKTEQTVYRVSKSLADALVTKGTHQFTTKSKLHSFLNIQGKYIRNDEALKQFDMSKKNKKGNFITTAPNGTVYAVVRRKFKEIKGFYNALRMEAPVTLEMRQYFVQQYQTV